MNSRTVRLICLTLVLLMVTGALGSAGSALTKPAALVTASAASPDNSQLDEATQMAVAWGRSDVGVPLAGPGQWAELSAPVVDAPEGATVIGVQVKYGLTMAQAEDVEIRLGSEGSEAKPILYQGTVTKDLLEALSDIEAFAGAPVNGNWSLLVQTGSGAQGMIDYLTVRITYEAVGPTLQDQTSGTKGQPIHLRLPSRPSAPLASDTEGDGAAQYLRDAGAGTPPVPGDDIKPPEGAPGGAPDPRLTGWETIKYESFEGAFPNDLWTVLDTSNDGYERYWDDDDYLPYAGSWAAWPANGGANGLDPQYYYYPNNMYSWMIYGPFDLSDAHAADTEFYLWREIEVSYDWVAFAVSADGTNFSGVSWDGVAGWEYHDIAYNDLVGDSSVWVAWVFSSDGSVYDDGPWVDNIAIWKNTPYCGPFASNEGASRVDIPDDGTWLDVPIHGEQAADDEVLAQVNVKYLIDHPAPSDLEIQLSKEGTDISAVLWDHGQPALGSEWG
ncbi:MAG: hypothetical protein EHM35_16940, partial [Planctomycetaceae bacterium]